MVRNWLFVAFGVVIGAAGVSFAHLHDDGERVRIISARDIQEQLDGEASRVSFVEVTINPGDEGVAHRHPGPGFGYVLEGNYELAIDDQPSKVLKQGETFYEPSGCLHRVSRNPSKKGVTRLLAVVVHPRSAQEIAVPEMERK